MDKTALQDGALGFAILSIVAALMLESGNVEPRLAALIIFPGAVVMIGQVIRYRLSVAKAANR